MKNFMKVTLLMAFTLVAVAASAQKSGRINVQELVMAMPETTTMQSDLEAIRKDFAENLETMQVELQKKVTEYQSGSATMNESVRALKEKDINDLNQRMQQFNDSAMQEIQRKQNEMLEPILEKARVAIADVAKAGGYTVIYDESLGALAYYDETLVVNILPSVKTKLGIK